MNKRQRKKQVTQMDFNNPNFWKYQKGSAKRRWKLYRIFKPTWIYHPMNSQLLFNGVSFELSGVTLKEYISPTVGRFTFNN